MAGSKVGLGLALLALAGCGQFFANEESRTAGATRDATLTYRDLQMPADEATISRAVEAERAIPDSVGMDVRFRCAIEAMVWADQARANAGKPSFQGRRLTNDPLVGKLDGHRIFLSDQPLPEGDIDPAWLEAHVIQFEAPNDTDAAFVYAAWHAAYLGKLLRTYGMTKLNSPEAKAWLNKGRSAAPGDVKFRHRANLSLGEKRCFDLLTTRPGRSDADLAAMLAAPAPKPAKPDEKLAARLAEAVAKKVR